MNWVRLAVMVIAFIGAPGAAMAEDSKRFHYECPRGSYLTGLAGRAGAWIDTIDIECAYWNASRQKLDAPQTWDYSDVGRSPGGGETSAVCDRGSVIAGNYTYDYARWGEDEIEVLHHVVFNCHPVNRAGDIAERRFGSSSTISGVSERTNQPRQCATGQFATGIQGVDGAFVYDFDFICRTAPVSPVAVTKPVGPDAYRDTMTSGRKGGGLIGSGLPPPPPPAQPTATAKANVDIYDGPGGQFNVTGMLGEGSTVPVLGHNADKDWYQLKIGNGSGWVSADWLTINP